MRIDFNIDRFSEDVDTLLNDTVIEPPLDKIIEDVVKCLTAKHLDNVQLMILASVFYAAVCIEE